MDPKIAQLLHAHEMGYWIWMLEAEAPMLVQDYEAFTSIPEDYLRETFEEMNYLHEKNERDWKLPKDKLDNLCETIYRKKKPPKKKPAAAEPAAPAAAKPAAPDTATTAAKAAAPSPELPCDGPLCNRWVFEQTGSEAYLKLRGLPMGTKAKDVKLKSMAATLSLVVGDEVVLDDAPIWERCVSEETEFDVQDAPGRQSRILTVTLTKANNLAPPWPKLLRGENATEEKVYSNYALMPSLNQ